MKSVSDSLSAIAASATGQMNGPMGAFIPDYTVRCIDTTSYMKVSRRIYLHAIRATLMEKQRDSSVSIDDEAIRLELEEGS